MEASQLSLSACQEDVHSALAPTTAGVDLTSVDKPQTNGEVSNKTSAACESTQDDQKSLDSDSESDTAMIHSHSRPTCSRNLGSGLHQSRKVVRIPYSLMSQEDKQARRKRKRTGRKKAIQKLEQRLRNRSDLSRRNRKRIEKRLKRLRPRNRRKHKKKAAADTEPDKERSTQKYIMLIRFKVVVFAESVRAK